MALKFTCLNCKEIITVEDVNIGGAFECYKCGFKGNVPYHAVYTEKDLDIPIVKKPQKKFQDPDYPDFKQGIYLVIRLLILAFLIFTPVVIIKMLWGSGFLYYKLQIIAEIGVLLLILKHTTLKSGLPFTEFVPIKKINSTLLIWMCVSLVGFYFSVSIIDNLIEFLLPSPDFFKELYLDEFANPFIGIIFGVILAPATEEIFGRGILLRGFLRNYSRRNAILLSAVFFALIHMNPWHFVSPFLLGILFGWWYVNTKSLLPSLIGHSLYNSITLVIIQISISHGYDVRALLHKEPQMLVTSYDIIGLILLLVGVYQTAKAFKKNSINDETSTISVIFT
ncbi:MAG: CPBP family intramembrane metalloprotease [candidate division Zixibacteria bacterium]|nr:CPBP family intramembrane metalloprotease [candidate division Zixibacteria bacterium]